MDCIFCKIANKEIDTDIIYEDDKIIAFKDMNPKAPIHLLVIPKKHINSNNEVNEDDIELIGYINYMIGKIAKNMKFDDSGYRIINNCGQNGGQTVSHLHYHVLAGRDLQWPPG